LPGICSVSAPVFRFDGSIAGSLTVLGVQGVLDISTDGPAAVLLKQAAKLLSEQMGTKRSGTQS
jgi:DNA-binding IclR family transcriptional regulator